VSKVEYLEAFGVQGVCDKLKALARRNELLRAALRSVGTSDFLLVACCSQEVSRPAAEIDVFAATVTIRLAEADTSMHLPIFAMTAHSSSHHEVLATGRAGQSVLFVVRPANGRV
jgi:hypothetical protein